MRLSTFALAATLLSPWVAGAALAADLDDLPPADAAVVVMPPPVVVVPAPVVALVPVPVLPFFPPPPPPPLPSYTLFSAPVGVAPPIRHHGRGLSPGRAEAEHYGYGVHVPAPRPLGFYGPDDVD